MRAEHRSRWCVAFYLRSTLKKELLYQGFQIIELKHIGGIAESLVWSGMDFKEISRCAEGFCRQCHRRNETTVTAGFRAIARAWTLYAVGAVHDDGGHYFLHIRNIAEVDDEVVVSEGVAAFGEPYFLGTSLTGLFDGIAHVVGAEELCFLDVDGLPGPSGSDKKVSLPTEEGRYLQDISDFGYRLCLPRLMNVSEDAKPEAVLDTFEHTHTFSKSWSPIGMYGGAVGLVKGGLEDDVDIVVTVDFHQPAGDGVEEFL